MATKNNSIDDIAKKVNYLVDIPLMINANITEYDISKANINMLLSYGLISKEDYDKYYSMPKIVREISIGNRMKNDNGTYTEEGKKFLQAISEGIYKAKYQLLSQNNIPVENVIRVANDAVYINAGYKLPITDFDINNNGVYIHFKSDKIYNMMLNFNMVTIFIYDNPMSDELRVDVKGINDKLLPRHEKMLEFICNIITDMQRTGKESILYSFNDFYEKYIKMELPIDYYREFNSGSAYKIKGTDYCIDFPNEPDLNLIDISYNLMILRQLYSIIMNF